MYLGEFDFSTNIYLGTIHLRRRHWLGGEGSRISQICRRIVVKNCRRLKWMVLINKMFLQVDVENFFSKHVHILPQI